MIYPRLVMARNMLAEDGVIFVSIGDAEVANLSLLMDEIFGGDNFLATITRVTKRSSNSGTQFSPSKDYVISFARRQELLGAFSVSLTEDQINSFNKDDSRGKYKEIGLYQAALKHGGSIYPIECPDGSWVLPPGKVPWRWSEPTLMAGLAANNVVFKQTSSSPLIDASTGGSSTWNIYTKLYLKDRLEAGMTPKDFLEDIQNNKASREIKALGIPFDFAKPSELVRYLVSCAGVKDGPVLDFFAGSGTTGHAVMAQNAEDGGNRRYILVQLPEATDNPEFPKISDITRERIRRAGKKIKEEAGLTGGELDTGFRSYKLSESNFKNWDSDAETLLAEDLEAFVNNINTNASDEGIVHEILIKAGIRLDTDLTTVELAGIDVTLAADGLVAVSANRNITQEFIDGLLALEPQVQQVYLLDSGFGDNDSLKVNARHQFAARRSDSDPDKDDALRTV